MKKDKGEEQKLRILELNDRFNKGEVIEKEYISRVFGVEKRTIQRDIKVLNNYYIKVDGLSPRRIHYSRKKNGHELLNRKSNLIESDIFAVSKILLDSRAFSNEEINRIINALVQNYNDGSIIKKLISNELFHYVSPSHNRNIVDFLWKISQSILEKNIVNVSYMRQDKVIKQHKLKPLGLVFNEYYFYLLAEIVRKDKYYQAVFRVDRFQEYIITEEKFKVDYKDRFEEGEYRKRIHFMYQGELMNIQFKFGGDSLEAVLDRIPTARVIGRDEDKYVINAEVYSKGIIMWLLSQREYIEVIRPNSLREEMKEIARNIYNLYC
ncbi:helix-turn-helix transcriptional regulator [Clostridium nigeriense]|uniref:helix-turn-helix transcriptional regulator n=1 Tax=Clostridium nigeriense TaxID=1805470 RepID=UPI00082ED543|nr:WYL domain-containing protein [Clostridium nigeriense]